MLQLGTLSERIKAEVTDTVANKSFSLFVVPFLHLDQREKGLLAFCQSAQTVTEEAVQMYVRQ